MVVLPCPLKPNGFIDEESVFKLAYGRLKLPFGLLDELLPIEFFWLLENKNDEEKHFYEMMAYAVQVGYVRANSKKKIKMFEDKSKQKTGTISLEDRERIMKEAKENFNVTF